MSKDNLTTAEELDEMELDAVRTHEILARATETGLDTEKVVKGNVIEGMDVLSKLRADVKATKKMEEGTVIRFVASDRYMFTALWVAGYWWLSGTQGFFGADRMTYSEFIEGVLGNKAVSNVEVATGWTAL